MPDEIADKLTNQELLDILLSEYSAQFIYNYEFWADGIEKLLSRNNVMELLLERNEIHNTFYDAYINQDISYICEDYSDTYHYDHNILIYGMDTDDKIFYTAGYNLQGKFNTQILSFKTIKRALPHKSIKII